MSGPVVWAMPGSGSVSARLSSAGSSAVLWSVLAGAGASSAVTPSGTAVLWLGEPSLPHQPSAAAGVVVVSGAVGMCSATVWSPGPPTPWGVEPFWSLVFGVGNSRGVVTGRRRRRPD